MFVGRFLILSLYFLIPNSIYHIVVSHKKKKRKEVCNTPQNMPFIFILPKKSCRCCCINIRWISHMKIPWDLNLSMAMRVWTILPTFHLSFLNREVRSKSWEAQPFFLKTSIPRTKGLGGKYGPFYHNLPSGEGWLWLNKDCYVFFVHPSIKYLHVCACVNICLFYLELPSNDSSLSTLLLPSKLGPTVQKRSFSSLHCWWASAFFNALTFHSVSKAFHAFSEVV